MSEPVFTFQTTLASPVYDTLSPEHPLVHLLRTHGFLTPRGRGALAPLPSNTSPSFFYQGEPGLEGDLGPMGPDGLKVSCDLGMASASSLVPTESQEASSPSVDDSVEGQQSQGCPCSTSPLSTPIELGLLSPWVFLAPMTTPGSVS